MLKGQGPAAPLGEMNFLVKGLMIGGFALAAAPAEYRVTGVKTFMVSHEGIVYEQDLGPETLESSAPWRSTTRTRPGLRWPPTSGSILTDGSYPRRHASALEAPTRNVLCEPPYW